MSVKQPELESLVGRKYRHGFVTDIASDTVAPGLDEDVIRLISAKKGEPSFMLDWRLKAFRRWTRMEEPAWARVHYPPIDFQAISYYSAPRQKKDGPKSLADVDPESVFPPLTAYAIMQLGRLALAPYYPPGDESLAEAVRNLAGKHHAILLANHGPVVAGATLDAAVNAIEELEQTAKLMLLLRGQPLRLLTSEQVAELNRRFSN